MLINMELYALLIGHQEKQPLFQILKKKLNISKIYDQYVYLDIFFIFFLHLLKYLMEFNSP